MSRTLTVRGLPPELAARLKALAEANGRSVNATVLEILREALGQDERAARLRRYATWTEDDRAEFEEALRRQRTVDEGLWR